MFIKYVYVTISSLLTVANLYWKEKPSKTQHNFFAFVINITICHLSNRAKHLKYTAAVQIKAYRMLVIGLQ